MPARVLAWKMYLVQEARRMSDILKKPKENAGLNQTQLETLLRFFLASKAGITQQMVGSVGFVYCSWPKMKLGLSKKKLY